MGWWGGGVMASLTIAVVVAEMERTVDGGWSGERLKATPPRPPMYFHFN